MFPVLCKGELKVRWSLGIIHVDINLKGPEIKFSGGNFGNRPNIFDITGLPGTDLLSSTVISSSPLSMECATFQRF